MQNSTSILEMIPIERQRDADHIPAKYRGAGKRRMEIALLKAFWDSLRDPNVKFVIQESYWKAAKSRLREESHKKCAYCECPTAVVAHGDVEHFRPKSVYWWLAYTYDNYLYACQICNQMYKEDHFEFDGDPFPSPPLFPHTSEHDLEELAGKISPDPVAIDQGQSLIQYIQFHEAERAFLLNPYFDNPAAYFAYEADDAKEEVKLVAKSPAFEAHASALEDYCGINRIELLNFRYTIYKVFRTYKKALKAIDDATLKAEIQTQIDEMLQPQYIFAGMNRYFDKALD